MAAGARSKFDPETFSFTKRLQEIGVFFQKRSPQHQTMRRLARRLKKAKIPYAVMGAMAVNAHGAERTTRDVDITPCQRGGNGCMFKLPELLGENTTLTIFNKKGRAFPRFTGVPD